jgi:Fe2+ or Zn2+ uptake regulation protein
MHATNLVLEQSLHSAGRRLTSQRALILSVLEDSDEHLDAEGIYEHARKRRRSLNLATVYRTLTVLKEMGLVEQRYFARDHKREYFEAVGKREHYHFTCLGCGKVIEVETPRIRQARQELGVALGLTFIHACVCFEGFCPECARNEEEPAADST